MEKNSGDDIRYELTRKSNSLIDDSAENSQQSKPFQVQDEDDYPNTRQLRQKDLQALYTGPQIESGEKFA